MKFALGTKEKMTSVYDENGVVHPATAVRVGDMHVVQVKDAEPDGYTAVQVGFGKQSPKRVSKALKNHVKKSGKKNESVFRFLKEFRIPEDEIKSFKAGQTISPQEMFEEGDRVELFGVSKGKGFQGVVKRHGFAGGPRTHGQKHTERSAGSIGATGPQRVFKGTRMAGRMGGDRVYVKNLTIVKIDKDEGLMYIRGALPGRAGTLIEIRSLKHAAK